MNAIGANTLGTSPAEPDGSSGSLLSEFQAMNDAMNSAFSSVRSLAQKLAPVLGPEMKPETGTNSAPQPTRSEYAERLWGLTRRLRDLGAEVDAINSRAGIT